MQFYLMAIRGAIRILDDAQLTVWVMWLLTLNEIILASLLLPTLCALYLLTFLIEQNTFNLES
jgi:hypothetical protein